MAHPLQKEDRPIRVLVVDDSMFMRRSIERLLGAMQGVEVVGTAADGLEAVTRALELRPDVITMDVEMPRLDGVSAVSEIMASVPTPIVMVSTLTTIGAETTIRAFEAGAVEAITKPSGKLTDLLNVGEELHMAIIRASHAKVRKMRPVMVPHHTPVEGERPHGAPARNLVVIGSSTGGPPALTALLPRLPGNLNAAVLVVQHMPAGFTASLARRLDQLSALRVSEAADGDILAKGFALVAPGNFHVTVGPDRRLQTNQQPALHGVRPSVDIALESVAEIYGAQSCVAILTGMGRDGADGSVAVERSGGTIVVQDEATCVVYGMPKVTKERTSHATEAPLGAIPAIIEHWLAKQAA